MSSFVTRKFMGTGYFAGMDLRVWFCITRYYSNGKLIFVSEQGFIMCDPVVRFINRKYLHIVWRTGFSFLNLLKRYGLKVADSRFRQASACNQLFDYCSHSSFYFFLWLSIALRMV